MPVTVTRDDVVAELGRMGLTAGDRVMLHSSLSSMGCVEGGAGTVVEAFLEILGAEGMLMVPTFIFSGATYFDPVATRSKCGAITEAVRLHPRAVRSYHPTHAVAVIGPDGADLVAGDAYARALGVGCALHRMIQAGGKVFLLGVGQGTNSAIHVGEDLAGDPDRHKRFTPVNPGRVTLNHPEKGEIEIELTSMMGHTRAFDELEELLRSQGQIRDGKIGEARCQVMEGGDVVSGTVEILAPGTALPGNTEYRM
jgi:aminoglycoside 3-N-acetyltransferase